eukprot:4880658-Pleurochrysis_carterae.AAC.1
MLSGARGRSCGCRPRSESVMMGHGQPQRQRKCAVVTAVLPGCRSKAIAATPKSEDGVGEK